MSVRIWLQSATTGDMGYMVIRDGKEMVRLDRGPDSPEFLYKPNDWIVQSEPRLMTEMGVADIQFHADRRLCYMLGEYAKSKRDWLSLREDERIHWKEVGPKETHKQFKARRKLYDAIAEALKELTE